ncbi:NCS1 family nucleobase:cation symporter-1 [Capronia epimyces CBS 606.96]|uniref:NCS1 family nucleobase:cation symporter-1 n=1 Tax=Capronia epimyces CBS 606.96 TaxID=1182542 RepID=W9XVX6_9EURO|nr:NCS1 family nucleobase:cation symporter-1 [Capronia epimyces CBS 606.96]EXJ84727.1 NCS1 family nucleobase:cation symporter-1 [Capronia epimyces CBS 606.96]
MEKDTDMEKAPSSPVVQDIAEAQTEAYQTPGFTRKHPFLQRLASWGVELHGVTPVPVEDRTSTRYINIFFVWFTMSINLLPIVTGMVGTLGFGMSLRDTSLLILFFSLFCTIFPAYFCTLGARTGLRQMLHARYTFGYYLVSIVVLLNLATIGGFGVIDAVVGGSTLSAVSNGNVNDTVGIVIITILALLVSFAGYKALHQYERYAWLPALIAIIIATGCGGKHLSHQVETEPPAASLIISFGGVIAGYMIPWAAMASDFAVYCHPSVSTARIFWYSYAGLLVPSVLLMILGAAIGGAAPNVPSWSDGYDRYSAGGVLEAMLKPAGGFGKFVAVILAFSLLGNIAATMYSVTLNCQLLIPVLVRVPRAAFAVLYTAVCIPLSIYAAKNFFDSLENFIYVIAYWSADFVAVVSIEHFVFRRADCATYDLAIWDVPRKLPSGIAAMAACALSFALIVPCMGQVWYTGPLAEKAGDIGFEVGLCLSAVLYLPFRWAEIRYRKQL